MYKLTVFINSTTQPQIQDFAGTQTECEKHLMMLRLQYTDLEFYLTDPAGKRVMQNFHPYRPLASPGALHWAEGWTEHR